MQSAGGFGTLTSPSWVLGCGTAAADLFFTNEKLLILQVVHERRLSLHLGDSAEMLVTDLHWSRGKDPVEYSRVLSVVAASSIDSKCFPSSPSKWTMITCFMPVFYIESRKRQCTFPRTCTQKTRFRGRQTRFRNRFVGEGVCPLVLSVGV